MSNKEDLQAINNYVLTRSRPAPGAPPKVVARWQALVTKWKGWYPGVMGSWYVSDSDLSAGKAIRNSLMQNKNPDAWEYVQKTAADKPGRLPFAKRPEAPGKQKKPWERKGLKRSRLAIIALQKEINAAGYSPKLTVDGKMGPKTKAGEKWLIAKKKGDKVDSTAKKAIAQIKRDRGIPPKPKPKKVEVPPAEPPVTMILGVPLNLPTLGGAAAGGLGGFLAGGPVGAAVGVAAGFLGGDAIVQELKP